MFNKKDCNKLFKDKKEQKYFKDLANKIKSEKILKLYEEFEKIDSYQRAEEFVKKNSSFIKNPINIDEFNSLNELKEKIAYEINEMLLNKFN